MFSGRNSFSKVKPVMRKVGGFLARELKQGKAYLEVYLVGKEFMEKNVLAFPAPKNFPHPNTKLKPLGEIYLNPDFISKDLYWPPTTNYELRTKLSFMLIHGFLHLLGYDHKKNSDRIIMEKKEGQLMRSLNR